MRTKEFLNKLEHSRIVAAIRAAEAKTSGEIRVYLQRGELGGDALVDAKAIFRRFGMEKTSERNGILVFVAPRARKFAVIGDEGIQAKCEHEFWERLVDSMRAHFLNSEFTDGLVEAIEEAGKLLARYFPKTDAPRNELPDEIIEG